MNAIGKGQSVSDGEIDGCGYVYRISVNRNKVCIRQFWPSKILLVFPENLCYNAKLKCSAQAEQAIHI